jgi:glutaredoxin
VTGTAGAAGSRPGPRVRIYTRDGCHLCDEARTVVDEVCAALGESFDEVDIDSDPELVRRFGEEVPVTFVDGAQHDFWRVDRDRLAGALRAGAPPG